jgi:hypothetical protein
MNNLTIEVILNFPHSMDHVYGTDGVKYTLFRFDNGITDGGIDGMKYYMVDVENGRYIWGKAKTISSLLEVLAQNYIFIEGM